MAGFVYIMSNPSIMGRIKIGQSSKDPKASRLRELSSDTSAPEPFHLEYYCYVEEYEKLERLVHRELQSVRPNKNREFFQISPTKAVQVIKSLAGNCGGIKFEESDFTEVEDVVEAGILIDKKVPLVSSKGETLQTLFPQANLIIEYRELAAEKYGQLENFPVDVKKDFLAILEKNPDISDEKLEKEFDEKFTAYLRPFTDPQKNFYYDLCRRHSREMGDEFLSVVKLGKDTIRVREVFSKLAFKYEMSAELVKFARVEDELTVIIAHLTEEINIVQRSAINKALVELGLHVEVVTVYGEQRYYLSRLQGTNTIRISGYYTSSQFVAFMKNDFDPFSVQTNYFDLDPDRASSETSSNCTSSEQSKSSGGNTASTLIGVACVIVLLYWLSA